MNSAVARFIVIILFAVATAVSTTSVCAASDPYSTVERRLSDIERHEGVWVTEIGRSLKDRPIYAVVFAREPLSKDEYAESHRILVISGQHGNEAMPVKAALSLIDDLATGRADWFNAITQQVVLVFVPIVNPDGYAAGRRVNAANVDLNRNWRLSDQPETAAISQLVNEFRPDVLIDQHEWVTTDTQRPNCIEVAGFGTDPQFKLARLLAAAGGQASPLLSTMAYSKTCNPGLAHRHFTHEGICSLLVETDPDRSDAERMQAYNGLVKAVATSLAGDETRIRLELAAMRSGRTEAGSWLMGVCSQPAKQTDSREGDTGTVGLCLVAMGGLLAWTFRLNSTRKRQPTLDLATVGPRTIRAFTVSELIQSDLAPSQKLAIIQRYRLRASDRAKDASGES